MAKLKMNDKIRFSLYDYAKEYVLAGMVSETAVIQKCYDAFEPIMLKHVETKFPQKDMEIVKKYVKETPYDPFTLRLTAGGYDSFTFNTGRVPYVAARAVYILDSEETIIFAEWRRALNIRHKLMQSKLRDYDALIRASKYFEDIVEIWPAAENMRPESANALLVISKEIVDRIKDDVAQRAA